MSPVPANKDAKKNWLDPVKTEHDGSKLVKDEPRFQQTKDGGSKKLDWIQQKQNTVEANFGALSSKNNLVPAKKSPSSLPVTGQSPWAAGHGRRSQHDG